MKWIDFIIFLLPLVTLIVAYDDLKDEDVADLAKNKEAIRQLWGCLVNKNKCSKYGENAKKHVIESLKDSCQECDTVQKHYGHVMISTLKEYPEMYEAFENMYDPDRKLLKKLDDTVVKYAK